MSTVMEANHAATERPFARTGNLGYPPWYRRIVARLELSAVLRVFGAGVMVAAIALFLFQRWESGNDLFRYGLLLTQTLVLSALGFATSRWLREPKSARVFLALGLVSTAACFTILGALLYSTVQWDAVSTTYPGYAFWQVDSVDAAMICLVGSMILLWPISQIGFAVLARPAAWQLTALFLTNGVLLVLPVRDPLLTTSVAAAGAVVSLLVLARIRRNMGAVRTAEGRLARLITLLPVAIVAGRSAYLYAEAFSFVCLGLLGYVTLRQMAVNSAQSPRLKSALEVSALLAALVTAMACADLAISLVGYARDAEAAIATITVVLVASLIDLAQRSAGDGRIYAGLAGALSLIGAVTEVIIAPSMITSVLCVMVSAAVAMYARRARLAQLFRLALVVLLLSVAHQIHFSIQAFDLSGWIGLAVLGMTAIVLAAALERHGERIKALVTVGFGTSEIK